MSYSYPARTKSGFTRVTACLVIEGVNTNPNGDPADAGRPRQNTDANGIISDVSIKRKIRDMLVNETPEAMKALKDMGLAPDQHQILLTKFDNESLEDRMRVLVGKASEAKTNNSMPYFDVRMFGFMGLAKNKTDKEDDKAETKAKKKEASQEKPPAYNCRGVAHFGMAVSLNKINITEHQITRCIGTGEDSSGKDKDGAMGNKYTVDYGLYPMPLVMNAGLTQLADNLTRPTDIELLRRLCHGVFADSNSSVRQLNLVRFYWYEHSSTVNDIPDWCLQDIWRPRLKPNAVGNCREDYEFYDPANPTELAKKLLGDNVKHIHDFAVTL